MSDKDFPMEKFWNFKLNCFEVRGWETREKKNKKKQTELTLKGKKSYLNLVYPTNYTFYSLYINPFSDE